jgi:hypothetical protein
VSDVSTWPAFASCANPMPARTARERSAGANSQRLGHKSSSTTSLRSLLSSPDSVTQEQQHSASPPPPLPTQQWSDVFSQDQPLPSLKPVHPQDGMRRGSLNPPQLVINTSAGQTPRPGLQLRTTSAPLIVSNRLPARNGPHSARTPRIDEQHALDTPSSSASNVQSAMSDEERSAADISSAMRSFQLLESLEVRRAFVIAAE